MSTLLFLVFFSFASMHLHYWNCFRFCFPCGIRLANIIIFTCFTLEIDFSGNFQGNSDLVTESADRNHQIPGGGILPVDAHSSGQCRKVESVLEENFSLVTLASPRLVFFLHMLTIPQPPKASSSDNFLSDCSKNLN